VPTPTKYTYSLATDFPDAAINSTKLTSEIGASSIVTALDRIDVSGDVVDVWFKDALSSGDETTLDGLPANHDSSSSIVEPKMREDGVLYTVPKSASYGYEMCDRDFKIVCSYYDAKALHTVVNGANGTVTYVAARSGSHGNAHSIEVKVGTTGAGHESRALAVTRAVDAITVTFGTDSGGNSVVPTALQVATLINSNYSLALQHMNAVPSGDGSGQVATVAQTNLSGGTNPSCEDLKINIETLKEVTWGELTLVGVYKDSGGAMAECSDQADADTNAILSVWEYTALSP
jgi:hypothetical protein